MAMSKCVACGGFSFELKQAEPRDSAYKIYFVQCGSCGGVVGVQDFYNVCALLHQQNDALNKIAAALKVSVSLDTR